MPKKSKTYGVLKRGMDFCLSAVSLVLLSPLFAIVVVAIKIDSPGPAFFRQKRVGRGGKEFCILKFRSMVADNDVNDNSCEDRYTRIGKGLRKTSIDELPQLINVLRGQMSFIGPRPWVPEYWENMNERERGRAQVRPGITGLAQAKGRNGLTIFEKIEYDLEYVANYSLRQDIKVLFLTVGMVLGQKEVDAGKSGIHDDIDELREENRRPGLRVILDVNLLTSVVVPVGSGARTVREVVNSVLGKAYDKIELMVMNEKITEEARKIMDSAAVDGVSVVKVGEGGYDALMDGAAAGADVDGAGGVGVGARQGRFLCFIDDTGDLWRPNKIGKQLEAMQEQDLVATLRGYGFAGADAGGE